jgi:hypothetical protein
MEFVECFGLETDAWIDSTLASGLLIIVFLAAALLLFLLCRKLPQLKAKLRDWLDGNRETTLAGGWSGRLWFATGAVVVSLALAWLEITQPYCFTQDDALVGEMPGVLASCRSVWNGVLPDYNPYDHMGAPALSVGGGTYPVTYLAYAVARHLLGNEYATLEVFAILHILAGYAAVYWASRLAGMGRMPAVAASLSFVLSGSILIMGRSWHTFLPVVVWMPLLAVAVMKMARGPVSWKWFLASGLSLGIAYHAEFPQLWAYSAVFFVLAIVWLVGLGRIPLRRSLWVLPALLLAIAMALPLLTVQLGLASDMNRPSGYGGGVGDGLLAMLLPYPLVGAHHPNGWGSLNAEYMGQLFYFGTLFAMLWAVSALALIAAWPGRSVWAAHVWTVCAGVALWLAVGHEGGLWTLLGKLPVLGTINNQPFRLLPLFVLFSVLSGGVLLERWLQRVSRRRVWEAALMVVLLIAIGYHVTLCCCSFYDYGFRPYPELPDEIASLVRRDAAQTTGRIASWAPLRSTEPSYALALPHNLPSIYALPAFGGYNPLVQWKTPFLFVRDRLHNDPTGAARAYGVRWFLKHRTADEPVFSPNPCARILERQVRYDAEFRQIKFSRVHHWPGLPDVAVMELDEVDPLCFVADASKRALPFRCDGAGIDVNLGRPSSASAVVVNFLWYPDITATVDGRVVPCRRDAWYRITVDVPAGAKGLAIRYQPAWRTGILRGLGLAGLSLVLAALASVVGRAG